MATSLTRAAAVAADYTHILADFVDVPAAQLRDAALVARLLVAAAGAAGLGMASVPVVRAEPLEGITGHLSLDGSHIAVHTFPDRGVLLLDVLALATHDPQRAVDVFARRLAARSVRATTHARG